jgi:arylsulfatase
MFSMDETADIGSDTASPVSDDYPQTGSEFTGTIDWVRIDIGDDAHDHLIDPDHLMHIAMVRQ